MGYLKISQPPTSHRIIQCDLRRGGQGCRKCSPLLQSGFHSQADQPVLVSPVSPTGQCEGLWIGVGLMLCHREQRWSNFESTIFRYLLVARIWGREIAISFWFTASSAWLAELDEDGRMKASIYNLWSVCGEFISWIQDNMTGGVNRVPANTIRWTNVGLMLGHRRRRWPNIKPAVVDVSCLLVSPVLFYLNGFIHTCETSF